MCKVLFGLFIEATLFFVREGILNDNKMPSNRFAAAVVASILILLRKLKPNFYLYRGDGGDDSWCLATVNHLCINGTTTTTTTIPHRKQQQQANALATSQQWRNLN